MLDLSARHHFATGSQNDLMTLRLRGSFSNLRGALCIQCLRTRRISHERKILTQVWKHCSGSAASPRRGNSVIKHERSGAASSRNRADVSAVLSPMGLGIPELGLRSVL